MEEYEEISELLTRDGRGSVALPFTPSPECLPLRLVVHNSGGTVSSCQERRNSLGIAAVAEETFDSLHAVS